MSPDRKKSGGTEGRERLLCAAQGKWLGQTFDRLERCRCPCSSEVGRRLFTTIQIKKHLVSDPRYDAVGSSSLREELFNTYLKAGVASDEPAETSTSKDGAEQQPAEDDHERDRRKKERKERAVLDRENKVRVERSKVNAEIDRSKLGLTREEGELGFRCAS